MKVLVVTTRNVATTSGELRLIKSRATAMRNHFGIDSFFVSYIDEERAQRTNTDSISYTFATDFITYSRRNPFSHFYNMKEVEKSVCEILNNQRDVHTTIISGAVHPRIIDRIRRIRGMTIILDIHGAIEELLEYDHPRGRLSSRLLYGYLRRVQAKQLLLADGAMVVSHALKEHILGTYVVPQAFPFFIIPCSVETGVMSDKQYIENRRMWRSRLGISENECLFIYSGGASKWQMVMETVDLYRAISSRLSRESRLLLMSHSIDEIKNQVQGDTNLMFRRFPPEVVSEVLCAGDFSFLLRGESITNRVAFPNKFLEYVQSLNYVISTPYVRSVAELIGQYDCGEIYRGCVDELVRRLEMRIASHRDVDSFNALISKTSYQNTIVDFQEFILSTQD